MSSPPVVERPSMAPSFTDQILGLPSQPVRVVPSNSLVRPAVMAAASAATAPASLSTGAVASAGATPPAPPVGAPIAPPVDGEPPVLVGCGAGPTAAAAGGHQDQDRPALRSHTEDWCGAPVVVKGD